MSENRPVVLWQDSQTLLVDKVPETNRLEIKVGDRRYEIILNDDNIEIATFSDRLVVHPKASNKIMITTA